MGLTLAPAPSSALQLTRAFLSHSVAARAPPQPLPPLTSAMCLPGKRMNNICLFLLLLMMTVDGELEMFRS